MTIKDKMAEITDINGASGIQNTDLMISCPENMTDVTTLPIHVMSVLQSALEIEKLIELFDEELAAIIPHDSLTYENKEEEIKVELGKTARHSFNYRLVLFGKSLGELNLSRITRLLDVEINKIETLASALIYPLRNALLYKRAVEKAYSDPLTGLNNRAAFDRAIEQELDLAQRHEHPLSLMMLDIDHFKDINDNYGHIFGDTVLRQFADCILQCKRRSDVIFRYGGEEFSILLRNTGLEGAKLLAERMRESVAAMKLDIDNNKLNITVSIGLAEFAQNDDRSAFIKRADVLLYEAKKQGRNQVIAR